MTIKLNSRFGARRVGACVFALALLSPVSFASGAVVAEGAVVTGLAQGARGDAVKAVQQALIAQGIQVAGGADGVYGPGTAAAVKQFQSSRGLAASGSVDDATALALGLASSPLLGLTQGQRGDQVKALQQRLIDLGVAVRGGADGVFGAGTAAALSTFQTSKGLAASGRVDEQTAAALGGVSASPVSAPQPQPPAPTAPAAVVAVGARGDAVKTVQSQLAAAGFAGVGKIDGIFGARTSAAVVAFQQSVGLPATGSVDAATAQALAAAATGSTGGGNPQSALLGLAVGARGDAVMTLQRALIAAGVSVRGGADGAFGSGTKTALMSYQQANGLAASGTVDEPTASALASGKTVTASPSGMVGLASGAAGAWVKALQDALIKAGVAVRGGADGIYGSATSQAVAAFQVGQGLPSTGKVDDATAAALANPKPPATPSTPSTPTGGFPVFGEKGVRVTALQSALINAGLVVRGGADGDYGPGTSAAVMDFQRAHGLSATGKVDDATAAALGLTPAEAPAAVDPATVSITTFPVQGRCYFGDSYGYPRSGGRTHLGVDIIAPAGKLLYAVADGTITKVYADYPGSLSGNGVRLTTSDGTYFFYAHMTGVGPGIAEGASVKAGQVVGTVGRTGSAGTNHLHFEIHPGGGSAVNPYPIVKAVDACNVVDPLPQ